MDLMKKRLETINKIAVLPKLKKEFIYKIGNTGGVCIWDKKLDDFKVYLYIDFGCLMDGVLDLAASEYDKYLVKPLEPIYEEKLIKKIVGYK